MNAAFKTEAGANEVRAAYRALLSEWPVPSEQLRIATHLGETFVVACGPKDAPALVAIHGAQANTAAYMGDAALWSQHFRVYAVDVPGEAGLSPDVRPPLDTDEHARWLDDVMKGLGLKSASFVGTSLGGWLSLDYAVRRPQRVERLGLICPAGIGKQKNFLLKALPLLLLGPWGMNRMRRMIFGPRPAVVTPFEQRFGALMELIGRNIRIRNVKIPNLTDAQLAALPPSIVVIGGKDALIDSVDTKARLEGHCPQAKVVFLPEGYHYLPRQAAAVGDFLRGAAPGVQAAA